MLCFMPDMACAGQSLIADYYPDASRGKAFGGLFLVGAIGGMLGSLYATNFGAHVPGNMAQAVSLPAEINLFPFQVCLWEPEPPTFFLAPHITQKVCDPSAP